MSKTNAFETDWLELLFTNINLANIGDATGLRADTAAGSLYVGLFTTAPTDSTNGTECSYGGYSRVAIQRSAAGWTVSGNNVSNTAEITFPICTSGTETAIGVAIFGEQSVSNAIYYGTLDSGLSISSGVTPQFTAGSLDINED